MQWEKLAPTQDPRWGWGVRNPLPRKSARGCLSRGRESCSLNSLPEIGNNANVIIEIPPFH